MARDHIMGMPRTFHQVTGDITFSSSTPGTFMKIDHLSHQNAIFGYCSKSWIEQITFSDHHVTQKVNHKNI